MRRSRGGLSDDSHADVTMISKDLNNTTYHMDVTMQTASDLKISPHSLVKKLEDMRNEIGKGNVHDLELMDFDHQQTEELDEYLRKRDEVCAKVAGGDEMHFDENGRTQLNLENAVIAGAKLLVDEKRSSRSMSKKLHNDCGINEDDILYKGLGFGTTERQAVMDVVEHRKASLVESFVDFQKQIQFKMHVLEGVAAKNPELAKSEASRRLTRKQQLELEEAEKKKKNEEKRKGRKRGREKEMVEPSTPTCTKTVDPLDCQKIIENYALEVASELKAENENKKRRRIAPIPFNIHLLDSDEEDETVDDMDL